MGEMFLKLYDINGESLDDMHRDEIEIAGWSWELIDKNTAIGPRIKIYNASNALADANIDATVRGL